PVFRNEREVYRIAGLAEDITESRRAAEELRRSESLKSAIFESSLDCVITIDHEGKIVEFNPAAEATFGLTREQARGKDMVELIVAPRLRDAHRYLATGKAPILGKRLELEAIRADGTEFPIELAITAIGATSRPMFTGFIRDITPRKEADGKIKRLNRVHAVLSGISTLTVRVHERRELFNGACRIAVEHGNFGMAWIGLFDPVTGDVTPVAWAGESAEEITKDKASARDNPPRGQGAVGRAIRERRPVFNNDITALTFRGPRLQEILRAGFRSQIALPLFEDQVVVGTLTMYARESNFFDDEELRLLTELAGAISFAIENISRQQRLDELARIRAVSSEINAAIIRIRERKALLEETCRIVSEHGKFEMVWIGAIDQDGQEVRAIAWRGFSEETARAVTGANINATQGTLGEAIQTRKPSVRNDIEAQLSGGELRQEALKQGCRSSMCLPVVVDDKVTALIVLFTTRREFFDDEEIALLNEMAGNISFALEHIQKEEKIGRLSRIQAVKGSINALIVRVCDRDELFTEACRIAVEHGNFGMAWIGAFDPATQDVTPVAWAGESAEEITRAKSSAQNDTPRGQGAVGRAIRERRLVFNNDITAHSFGGPRLQEILKVGFRSQITLPLFEEQAVVATLTMYAGEPNFFDDEELRLLTELSGDISFALENISRQQKLEKLARIRAVSSETNAAIIRIHEREALLRETCRIAETYGNFKLVWVATLDQEKQKLQPLAWKGFAPEAANAVSWASMSARGTMREAILTRKPAVRNDIQDMPVGRLREEALQKGYGSSVCLPLMVDDNVVALIVLFAPGVGFFDEEELTLLNEVASNISFALHAIDKNERVDYLAYYDVLTGLANRSLFLERVGQYMRSAVSGGHKLAVGLIDLERFKNINDSLGQAGGDALLKQVAEWLTRNLGDPNLSARVGADHFAVVLPEIRKEGDVARLVEKLVEAFLEHPFRLNDTVFRIAVKVGVAVFPDDGAEADALFKNAEAAIKKAMASDERYLFNTQKMNDSVATKLTLENQLRQALDNE
ncbi:MAG: hypothetical protein QOK44_4250, partial [Betaproteobacteria bacterium]|nr:hypothetical protein [Betaproteobacteria bacterium]